MEKAYPPWPIEHVSRVPDSEFWRYQDLFFGYERFKSTLSFRLLKLEKIPDDARGRYYYSIIQTDLSTAPNYEALSYVWGTSDRDVPISLKSGRILRITRPLREALTRVERICSTGYLWIDQICIDQDDSAERGHQVGVMGQIYSSCSRVIIWLGTLTPLPRGTGPPKPVRSYSSSHTITNIRRTSFDHIKRRVSSFGQLDSSLSMSSDDERLACFQSPWFQRAWVMQEVVLPPISILVMEMRSSGKVLSMSLQDLNDLIKSESSHSIMRQPQVSAALSMYDRWVERQEQIVDRYAPLEETLSLLAPRAKTSEQLDQLYAFFGLNMNPAINLLPSYEVTLEEAILATTIAIIQGTGSLDILEFVPRTKKRRTWWKTGLPSWTPDFRIDQAAAPFRRSNVNYRQLASRDRKRAELFPRLSVTSLAITAHCFALDHIYSKIGTLSSDALSSADFDLLLRDCQKAWKEAKTNHTKFEATSNRPGGDFAILMSDFSGPPTSERLSSALLADEVLSAEGEIDSSTFSHQRSLQKMHGRTLWITRSGRLASGVHLQRNDRILLAYGCSNPVVLREHQDAVYITLGTCYLEGFMDARTNRKFGELETASGKGLYVYGGLHPYVIV